MWIADGKATADTDGVRNQSPVSGGNTRLVYVQPDTSGVWAGRPMALVVPVPAGATRLEAYLMSAGMSGGSGRRGAPGTARSGGQGGGPGGVNSFVIPLTAASTVTLTVGAPPPVAPGITTDDTNGKVPTPVGTDRSTVLVCDGASYASNATDQQTLVAASTAALGASARGFGTWLTQTGGATSITGAPSVLYAGSAGEVAGPGTGGGSLSTGDVALSHGSMYRHYLSESPVVIVSPDGAPGWWEVQGLRIIATGGLGGAVGQPGGNGGPGCGGGGGGASANGTASGAGGLGGFGAAVLMFS